MTVHDQSESVFMLIWNHRSRSPEYAAGMRYQRTFNGKRNHAARQARYRMRQREIVTHRGSPSMPQHASMNSLENKPEKTEKKS